ncbi:MAG: TRAM domain-containing protein [Actinomycetota bacterium]
MVLLSPERLVAGGDALARLDDGRIAFVPGALPGDTVEAEIVDDRRDFVRLALSDVVEPSPDRVTPRCVHRRDGCGGCGWMHLARPAQLPAKVAVVEESLRRIARLDPTEIDRLVSAGPSLPDSAARTTIRVVGIGGGVAFREEGSDRPVPISSCPVAHPTLSGLLSELSVSPGVELTLRTSEHSGAVTALWSRPRPSARRRRGRRGGDRQPTRSNGPSEDAGARQRAVEGLPRGVHVGPGAHLFERVAGVEFRVSAPSFWQSSAAAAEVLVATVADLAPEAVGASHLLDAYGGVGLFAATVGRGARHVTVVESNPSAVADARVNLASRGPSVTVVRSDVGDWEPNGRHAPPIGEPGPGSVDVVVADPARPGLGRPGVRTLVAAGAPVVALVSCDPVSAARDIGLMREAGYAAERLVVLDLFPETHHVETVTRFTRFGRTIVPESSSRES